METIKKSRVLKAIDTRLYKTHERTPEAFLCRMFILHASNFWPDYFKPKIRIHFKPGGFVVFNLVDENNQLEHIATWQGQ